MEGLAAAFEAALAGLIELTARFVIPDWGALVGLLPVGVLLGVLGFLGWLVVRYRAAGPTRRGPGRVAPRTPDGIHMPGPSLAPFLVAVGAFLLFFGLILGVGSLPFVLGVIALFLTLVYWLREGMRDYDAIEAPASVPALSYGGPPPGIHMPGPSFRPLLVSAAAAVLFAGLIVGPALLVGGVILLFITMTGWLGDAGREYRATVAADSTGHLETEQSPPLPIGTLIAFVLVLVVGIGLSAGAGAPTEAAAGGEGGASAGESASGGTGDGGSGGMTDGGAAESAAPAVEADLVLVALNIEFDLDELTAAADTPFTIALVNEDAGIPHNVAIHRETATGEVVYLGDIFNGVETRVYEIPALPAGAYAFVCTVHPNMVGTLTVQ